MEFKFNMEVDTPKQKVSAIRKVVALSSLSYDERLLAVKKILWDFDPGHAETKPLKPQADRATLRFARMSLLYKRLISIPMDRRERVLAMLLSHSNTNAVMRELSKRLRGDEGIGSRGDYASGYNLLWRDDLTRNSSGIIASALCLGFERGQLAMTLCVREGFKDKAVFHTSSYAAFHPEIKWENFSMKTLGERTIWIHNGFREHHFSGDLGK